jgi:nucleotide-binding universal stress UspA family protein
MCGVAVDVLARDGRRLEESGFTVETHLREGNPADTILDVAAA